MIPVDQVTTEIERQDEQTQINKQVPFRRIPMGTSQGQNTEVTRQTLQNAGPGST